MASIKYTNNAKTTLAADLNDSATSATVVNGNLFPSLSSGEHFYCTFDDGTNTEIVKVTARSTHVLTIVRAQDNTSALAFSSGDKAELRITAVVLEEVSTSASSWNTDIFAGDGSATAFTLTQAATDEKYLQVYIDGAFQAHNTYSVSGTTLTFVTAPANTRVITVYHIEPVALGTATGATITANNSTNETVYPTFVDGATGTQGLETDTGLTYNPSTGMLTSTGFTGALTGNASTATALATARTIHGVSFDGTANIDLSEVISDTVGAMVSSNTESGITVAYDDADNTLDFTVGTLNQNTTGSAATLTTPRAIAVAGDVTGTANFDGSAGISITTTLATDAIVTANITDANVTVAKMAANSVDSDQYVDGSIDTAHIGDDQVTGAKIENAVTIATSVTSPLIDGQNFKINGGQGTDGQLLTSTGSGVAWEDAPAGGPTFKTFGTSSIMIGDTTTGTIDAADNNTGLGVDVFAALTSGDGNVAVGFAALTANTTGNHNVSIGKDALAANVTAHRATAVGYQALKASNVSGNSNSGNTAVGFEAGTAMTTGIANTLVGALAGDAITTGSYNTAVGYDALTANTTGGENTAFGFTALQNNTTAGWNTGLGRAALEANTEGANNTGVGHNALGACTTGNQNVAVGNYSLNTSVEGNYQTAVGYQALKTSNYTANVYAYNTAVGWNAGLANTTGKVTAVGAAALTSNTTGINNAAFGGATDAGGAALEANTTGSYNTAFGYAALRNNTTAGDNAAFGAAALQVNTTGAYNTAIGRQALQLNTTASSNTAVGYLAGGANTTGAQSIYVGYSAGNYTVLNTTGNYNTMIGPFCHGTAADTTNANVIGYNVAGEGGYTTIGISGDDIRAAHGTATWATVSDERVKKDIADSTAGLSFINDLRPRTFNFKAKGDLPKEFTGYEEGSTESYKNSKTQHGFIAQEVKAVIDNHSELTEGFNLWNVRDTGQQEVAEAALIPMLVKAIQELSAEVEKLKGE
jgi:trimeric autotransporter adhesin